LASPLAWLFWDTVPGGFDPRYLNPELLLSSDSSTMPAAYAWITVLLMFCAAFWGTLIAYAETRSRRLAAKLLLAYFAVLAVVFMLV